MVEYDAKIPTHLARDCNEEESNEIKGCRVGLDFVILREGLQSVIAF